jgi:hypothetical protein
MTCYNSELPIGPPGPTGPQGEQGPPGESATSVYKVYTALLTQVDNNPPTAIELQNTIEGTISFTYLSNGLYQIENTIGWDVEKTFYLIGGLGNIDMLPSGFPCFRFIGFEGTSLIVYTFNNSLDTPTNNILKYTPIEIRVYP